MTSYILRRMLVLIPTLIGITIVVFAVTLFIPGDPAMILLGQQATVEQVEILREDLGLDAPAHIRYFGWLKDIIRGDFGRSLIDRRPVLPVLFRRFPATLQLLFFGVVLSTAIGIPVGILCAVYPNTKLDAIARILSLIGVSTPSFWLALLLLLLFSYHLRLLPMTGYQGLEYLLLPGLALGAQLIGLLTRLTRSTMLDKLQEDYIRTARSKGLAERVVLYKHTLRNAMLPLITIIGLRIGHLLGGTVVIETVFDWPGVGRYAYTRMLQRDYPAIMANLLVFAFFFCIINLITDILYGLFDPRIKYD